MIPAPNNILAAVIFDFDGVIVDTEPLHYEAFHRIVAPFGMEFSWETYRREFMGFDDRDAFRAIFRKAGRPIVTLAKTHTTVSVERAMLRLAGLSGAGHRNRSWGGMHHGPIIGGRPAWTRRRTPPIMQPMMGTPPTPPASPPRHCRALSRAGLGARRRRSCP